MQRYKVPVSLCQLPPSKAISERPEHRLQEASSFLEAGKLLLEEVDARAVSMNLNPAIMDIDIDGPDDFQKCVAMAITEVIGPQAFYQAFKRESGSAPSHYLFTTSESSHAEEYKFIDMEFNFDRCIPDGGMVGKIEFDFRSTLVYTNPEAKNMHTVLPGAVYDKKNGKGQELLEWVSTTENELKIMELPTSNAFRKAMFLAMAVYSLAPMFISGERHISYQTVLGFIRTLNDQAVAMDSKTFIIHNADELEWLMMAFVRVMGQYSGDTDRKDRELLVKSTLKHKNEDGNRLPGKGAFAERFKIIYGSVVRLREYLAALLGAPQSPKQLDQLVESTIICAGSRLSYMLIEKSGAWDEPPIRIHDNMGPEAFNARFAPVMMANGEAKPIPITRLFMQSSEAMMFGRSGFDLTAIPAHKTIMHYDEVSGRPVVEVNLFTGFPFSLDPSKRYNKMHPIIEWFSNTAKLLTQNEEEARWLICRVAAVWRNPERIFRTMPLMVGEESTGKSKFVDMVNRMVGRGRFHMLSAKELSNEDAFNGNMRTAIIVSATEVDLQNLAAVSQIRKWSSEPYIHVEGKGIEAAMLPNPIRLIMMATNDDTYKALNEHNVSPDTRLSPLRARLKSEDIDLRNATINLYHEIEDVWRKGGEKGREYGEYLRWYLEKADINYDVNFIEAPLETEERSKLRATQLMPDHATFIEMLAEPHTIQILAAARRMNSDKQGIFEDGSETKGCVYISSAQVGEIVDKLRFNDQRKANKYAKLVNGGLRSILYTLCQDYILSQGKEMNVGRDGFKLRRIGGRVVKVIRMPPYLYTRDWFVGKYSDTLLERFDYEHLCDQEGYIVAEPDVIVKEGGF